MAAHFTPRLFAFLREIKANNEREWFQEHRARYAADVETPMLQFIADLGPKLARISPAVVADPRRTGGSMFRIYRDIRFSADKSPFKTTASAWFPHEKRKTSPVTPGFYLHLEPRSCFGGGGIYHPDTATLTRIRARIVSHGKDWERIKRSGIEIEGDALQRAPAGFDPTHRFVEDLKRKDLFTTTAFTMKDVCAGDFLDRYADACVRAAPLVEFLTKALGWRW